jgi:hypothetical protein
MRGVLAVLVFALVGLFGAASVGYAAYVVSRDSVGLPATKLRPARTAPAARRTESTGRTTTRAATTSTRTVTSPRGTTTVDDHGGRGRDGDDHSGKGSGGSGKGGDD